MKRFWIKTGGRIHLGQLDLNGSLGRIYGGMGLAIDEPCLEVTLKKSDQLRVSAPIKDRKRIENIAGKYLEHYQLPGAKINLVQALPSHSGLGSGTQLSLVLGFAITRLYELNPSLAELVTITDRESSRSGIGVAAFADGGFLADGGKPTAKAEANFYVPPLLLRIPFPEEWSIILALPEAEEKMFGSKEEKAFRSLSPMEEEVSGKICRLLVMRLLPGLMEKDLQGFGSAVTKIQHLVGNYFAPVQGGEYACQQGERLAEFMLSQGAAGVGQSSWGPTIYGFTSKEQEAGLLAKVKSFLGNQGRAWATAGRNRGAEWEWKT